MISALKKNKAEQEGRSEGDGGGSCFFNEAASIFIFKTDFFVFLRKYQRGSQYVLLKFGI